MKESFITAYVRMVVLISFKLKFFLWVYCIFISLQMLVHLKAHQNVSSAIFASFFSSCSEKPKTDKMKKIYFYCSMGVTSASRRKGWSGI